MPKLNVIKKFMVERVNTMLSISAGYTKKKIFTQSLSTFFTLFLFGTWLKKLKLRLMLLICAEDKEELLLNKLITKFDVGFSLIEYMDPKKINNHLN